MRSGLAASLCAVLSGALFLATALAPPAALAQASFGQYLVVLDDSGSMDRSDPERLVVMASLALAGALEDGDQVMHVGLNELASGDVSGPRFVSPRELLPERDGASAAREVSGERAERIGAHHGETPCRAALERARAILEAVAGAGAPQTLLVLTDGACNGGAVEPAARWLAELRSHREQRFRFVPLVRSGQRADRELARYAEATGWRGEASVSFDARSLTRAFAEVLSFSRGLRYDEGGRVGLERTFAGARAVRVLAIREEGEGPIPLERVTRAGAATPIATGLTFHHPTQGWSVRTAVLRPGEEPFAVRSAGPGVEVLVVPVYGRLRVDAVVGPCDAPPTPPFAAELAVRAGQPACAYARLVGDTGSSIVPGLSFDFDMASCGEASCASPTPMQPGAGGVFSAQLGAEIPEGRHERAFRASGGALALPVSATRGFTAMTFGVHGVALSERPEEPITELDLGVLPQVTGGDLELRYEGSFPSGAHGVARCEVEGSDEVGACLRCSVDGGDDVVLEDGLRLHARVAATTFCAAVSAGDGRALPVRMRLVLEPRGGVPMTPHVLPLRATLEYAAVEPLALEVLGGDEATLSVHVPGPVAPASVVARIEELDGDPAIEPVSASEHARAGADRRFDLRLHARASDCCSTGEYEGVLVLSADESELRVPVTLRVNDPGFWVCPGQQIALALLVLALLGFVAWVVHGYVTPAQFAPSATLAVATSLASLRELREGDDGWHRVARFREAQRRFKKPARIWLGGPDAPLPSLKRQPPDGRIEAQPGGGAVLVVTGPGVHRWNETESEYLELAPGTYPIGNRVRLRREETHLEMRR